MICDTKGVDFNKRNKLNIVIIVRIIVERLNMIKINSCKCFQLQLLSNGLTYGNAIHISKDYLQETKSINIQHKSNINYSYC